MCAGAFGTWMAVFIFLVDATHSTADSQSCGAGDGQGKCGYDDGSGTYASVETGRGAGTAAVPKCGSWCGAPTVDSNAPCAIDTDIMPCAGEYWCTSTCGLWNVSILQAASPEAKPLSCEQFIRTSAYPKGGEVCKKECLLAEIRPNRYPAPTGLGFLCAPGTCDPAVQNRYNGTFKTTKLGLLILECPCNWFGSDCREDWVEITSVLRKERLGDFETTVFKVSEEGWMKVMADHRPGGVVRVQMPSSSAWGNRPLEQPYALANDAETGVVGELEVLTGAPEAYYFPTVTEVAFRVRALPVGPIADGRGKLYINPSVGGFFNKRYRFLEDALAADDGVEHVLMLATGAGLGGVRTVVAKLLRAPVGSRRKVHLYYGLRDLRQLPYRELLDEWSSRGGGLSLTLAVSSNGAAARTAPEAGIAAAVAKGDALRALASQAPAELQAAFPASGKLYAQHALGLDLAAGALREAGASLSNAAVVVCGRSELLLDTDAILGIVCGAAGAAPCAELLPMRVFTNI